MAASLSRFMFLSHLLYFSSCRQLVERLSKRQMATYRKRKHFCAGHVYSERCLFSSSRSEALEWKRETLRSCKVLLLRLPFSYKIDCILPPVARVTKKIEERFIYLFAFIFFLSLSPSRVCASLPLLERQDRGARLREQIGQTPDVPGE